MALKCNGVKRMQPLLQKAVVLLKDHILLMMSNIFVSRVIELKRRLRISIY